MLRTIKSKHLFEMVEEIIISFISGLHNTVYYISKFYKNSTAQKIKCVLKTHISLHLVTSWMNKYMVIFDNILSGVGLYPKEWWWVFQFNAAFPKSVSRFQHVCVRMTRWWLPSSSDSRNWTCDAGCTSKMELALPELWVIFQTDCLARSIDLDP